MAATVLRALGWSAFLVLVYFAYIDQFTTEEGWAALACAVAIAAFVLRVERIAGAIPLPPLAGCANVVRRTPLALLIETWLLGVVLFRTLVQRRRVPGRWVALRYEKETAGEAYGRRAAVVLGSAISPNAIPLCVDADRGLFVLHQLYARREPGGDDPRYPF